MRSSLPRCFASAVLLLPLAVPAAACGNDVSGGHDNPAAGGAAPVVVATGAAPLTPEEYPAALQYARNCGFNDGGTFSHYIRERTYDADGKTQLAWSHLVPLLRCAMEKKNGCQGMQDCLGYNPIASAGTCDKATFRDSCDGDINNACIEGPIKRTNCAQLGFKCADGECKSEEEIADDQQRATYAPKVCDPKTYAGECIENAPVTCGIELPASGSSPTLSFKTRINLGPCHAADGLACIVGHKNGPTNFGTSSGEAVCQGTGTACSADELNRAIGCNGALLKQCAFGRESAPVDCSKIGPGVTCVASAATASGTSESFHCGLATQCFEDKATCDGTVLTVCNGGRFDRVDCKALGFERCYASSNVQATCLGGAGYPQDVLQTIEAADGKK